VVPTVLPITVNANSEAFTADNARIINDSYGPVEVINVQVNPKNSWGIVSYGKDFGKAKVGLKEFGLKLNSEEVNDNGKISLSNANWPVITGNSNLKIDYNANIAIQKTALNKVNIADVVFTLNWAESGGSGDAGSQPEYVSANDNDFSGNANGEFKYIGSNEYVEIPNTIKGVPVTSYESMFMGTSVKGVKSDNTNVTNMKNMFRDCQAASLNLSNLDTSGANNMENMFYNCRAASLNLSNLNTSSVNDMNYMFYNCQAASLNLSNFDTSNVTNMERMFCGCQAISLNLSNFVTSSVTNMGYMFCEGQATNLDLSSFDTSNVTDMNYMFKDSITTTGYAKTQTDADKLNATSSKPTGLNFVVKP
jgi:surface protein